MAKFTKHVVIDAEWFAPGDDVPDWAVDKIGNPKVWDGETADTAAADGGEAAQEQPKKKGASGGSTGRTRGRASTSSAGSDA